MVHCVAIQTEPRKSKDVPQLRFCDVKFKGLIGSFIEQWDVPLWTKKKEKKENQVEEMFKIQQLRGRNRSRKRKLKKIDLRRVYQTVELRI